MKVKWILGVGSEWVAFWLLAHKGGKRLKTKQSQTFLQNQRGQNTTYTMVAISIFKEQK